MRPDVTSASSRSSLRQSDHSVWYEHHHDRSKYISRAHALLFAIVLILYSFLPKCSIYTFLFYSEFILFLFMLHAQRRKELSELPVGFLHQKKGWMNAELFTEWLSAFNAEMARENRRILMVLVNFSGHKTEKTWSNIEVCLHNQCNVDRAHFLLVCH
jgi:hypothetical protein